MPEFTPSEQDLAELPGLFDDDLPETDEGDIDDYDLPFAGSPVTPPGFARMVNNQRNLGLVW